MSTNIIRVLIKTISLLDFLFQQILIKLKYIISYAKNAMIDVLYLYVFLNVSM